MESIVYIIRDKNTKKPITRRDAYDPYNATPEKDSVEFQNVRNINNIVARTTKQEYFKRVA